MKYPFVYTWGNNEKRISMKNRYCRIVASPNHKSGSALVEFYNGQREIVSRRALKRRSKYVKPI